MSLAYKLWKQGYNDDDIYETCVHEAGHVVMAQIMGVSVTNFNGPNHRWAAAVTHEYADQDVNGDSLPKSVQLKREAMINVAGEAAEFAVLGLKRFGVGKLKDQEQGCDRGLYFREHRRLAPNIGNLDKKWEADFSTAAALFGESDAQEALKEATDRFYDFMTIDVHVDLSAIDPHHRQNSNVKETVDTVLSNLVGARGEIRPMLKYCAAQMIAYDRLGVKGKFVGPAVLYKGGDVKNVQRLTFSLGKVVAPDNWIEKLMRATNKPEETLRQIGIALVAGAVAVPNRREEYGYHAGYGESDHKLSSRLIRLYKKYDPTFRAKVKQLRSSNNWSKAWAFEQSLAKRLRKAAKSSISSRSIQVMAARMEKTLRGN